MRSAVTAPTAGPRNLFGLDREQLAALLGEHGAAAYHADQLFRWLYRRRVLRPALWTDLPRTLRERLVESTTVDPGTLDARTEAADGTLKFRVSLPGGGAVEAVRMLQSGRVTLCVSSQVGCALDCDFCLTGKMGLLRHLAPGEILGQVARIQEATGQDDAPFSIVFMGMGEPLHNYDSVLSAFRVLTDPDGFRLSRRRITISTAGLVPGIERLAAERLRPRLAVSLNATTDEVRDRIMPINRKYDLAALVEACRRFTRATGERVTFEYVLLRGVNDSDADVARLVRWTHGLRCKVNLIPFNAVPGRLAYAPPERARVVEIRDRLVGRGVRANVRYSRGAQARAACGQLALDAATESSSA